MLNCCRNLLGIFKHCSRTDERDHSSPRSIQAAPPRLVVLDIGLNFVDDEAMEVVARGLEKNRVLTTLVLQGNGIGEKVNEANKEKEGERVLKRATGRSVDLLWPHATAV